MRQQTDVLNDRAWSVSYPTEPGGIDPPTEPQRAQQQRRVRPRPHPKYDSPHEMWEWHWVKMRILLTWVLVIAVSLIVLTAGVIIFTELT